MEQRKLKRRHLIYYLRVYDTATNLLLGHVVDVTTEGLMLISEEQIIAGTIYNLKMVLPEDILQKPEIMFQVKSLWCKKDINPDFYATGLNIMKIDENDLDIIDTLIRKFGFND